MVVVGTLPPPVHGASLITERVADWLERRGTVHRIDIEPEGAFRWPRKAGRYLGALGQLGRHRGRGLYLPSSGGEAILADAAVCRRARALGYRIAIHHHSHTYVHRHRRPMAALAAAAGPDALHLVGCEQQGARLRALYPSIARTQPLSNAPIALDPGELRPDPPTGPLRLGHLANLSLEKGLGDVLALAEAMTDAGRDVEVVLGGPVTTAEARDRLTRAEGRLGSRLRALGALDEAGKAAFFRGIDLFVFPSRYRHETLPVVVHEAMSHGVPVLATAVGCVAAQVDDAGVTIDPDADFVAEALPRVDLLVRDPALRTRAREAYLAQLAHSEVELGLLADHLLAG
jgi:glycosyltransferase involved in cell wall biosynthesis